ncbi:DUF5804 family protein [Natrarchaeobius chitinivorans]|uniref:Uncharacterized protein n=1 Tax=Natrarchaeobius chitinivorans TaxID=1679083 RepID=A0A3N6M492_NATCH|nr:DUF5804 family protein [Natrarchaeobius chitinivorans]RQG90770.1 hypothetical protein EA473_20185 [Natrarchaeobius chitinivorans]
MTRVCLIGDPDCTLQYELLSRETSREALATYDLTRPFENSLAVRTVSIGAAVSLLNDLEWYLTRFVDEALVQEPSVSDDEWLSRPLARALRNGEIEPSETGEFCKVYGLERVSGPDTLATPDGDDAPHQDGQGDSNSAATSGPDDADSRPESDSASSDGDGSEAGVVSGTHRLVEPLFVRRTGGELPEYDLRDVDETLVVRLTESEYSP